MSTETRIRPFILPTPADVENAIVEATIGHLRKWIDEARPGFCARVDDLPARSMSAVAERLYTEYAQAAPDAEARAHVRLLVERTSSKPWECRWTEAVRLRNPDERGHKRPPLLLLIPPGTPLLGSLDADTFKVISCDTVVQQIVETKARRLPRDLAPLSSVVKRHATSDLQRIQYLMAVEANGYAPEAAGLALCLLGLWPHEGWLATGEQQEYWLTRNKEIVTRLRGGTTSLFSRVHDLDLKSEEQTARLYQLLSSMSSIEAAAAKVATDPAWRDLDFGRWDFASRPEMVVIKLDPLNLPQREDGYEVLRLQEQPHLALSWSADPSPAHVPDLTHYHVELLSSPASESAEGQVGIEDSPVAYRSEAIPPGKSSRKSFRVRDLKAYVEGGSLPEGLYRVRVTAWARATNITAQPSASDGSDAAGNVSDYFWIEFNRDEPDTETPPRRQERTVADFLSARREMQWDLIALKRDPWSLPSPSRSWDSPTDGKSQQATCTVQFGRQTFHIRLSNLLRRMEAQILAKPEELGALSANLTYGGAAKDLDLSARPDLPRLSADDPFLAARSALFAKLRGEDGQGLVETADLLSLRDEIVAYATEYAKLLRDAEQEVAEDSKRWPERVGLATMDTIRVRVPGLSEQTSVAILLAPTHPLRLLWSLQLALLGEAWLREAWRRGTPEALSAEIRQALQGGLHAAGIPPVLFDRRRVGYLWAGQVAPGWSVYLPANIADKQSALSRLSRALAGTATPLSAGATVSGVSDRVLRYLRQHPYVSELQINVFNPSDGKVIVELLNSIDKEYADLRYEVRLFSHEEVRDDLGSALDQLVNPEITVTLSETAEKYSQSGKYPLHPNLRYSKHRVSDFLKDPSRFQAHISLLLDVFHPSIDITPAFTDRANTDLFGLVHEEVVRTYGSQGQFAWERQIIAGPSDEIGPGAVEAALLSEALAATQEFVAVLGASPSDHRGRVPTVRLELTIDGQNLLYEIHRTSDWVLTLDRHLGIDYFDSAVDPDAPGAPAILLDFSPEFPASDQAVLMLTTQVGSEIDQLVAPALQRLGLDLPGSGRKVVEWLRSLSGRLAMRLLAAPMASQGVVGMALARAFLERLGVLEDTLVIPVDAHVDLLRKGSRNDVPQNRTDLILVHRVGASQLELTLVEVKCIAGTLMPGSYHAVREEIETQLAQTQAALASLFDPLQQNPDHLDRPLRNRALRRWLRFYVGRARRYHLLTAAAERTFLDLLTRLGMGYTVSFRHLGIVFELGRDDDTEDTSGDVAIHRIGRLSCERLVRGGELPTAPPLTWDRLRSAIRGAAAWVRTSSGRGAGSAPPPEDSTSGPSVAPREARQTNLDRAATDVAPVLSPATDLTVGPLITNLPGDDHAAARTHQARALHPDASEGTEAESGPSCTYLVGDTKMTAQWGVLGKLGNDIVGIDLDGCNTLSIFGVQGAGKSYTMGSILEMAVSPLPGLNVLPRPLAAVVFHYNESEDYPPEFVSMVRPNSVPAEVTRLREEYGGEPRALGDLLVLAPGDKVGARQREFPGVRVEPIAFHPAELTIQDWRFLMGAIGNDSLYIRQMNLIMRSLRDSISVEDLRQGIKASQLSEAQRKLALLRLEFAEQFVRDGDRLRDKLYPGRLVVVDLRDELVEKDEALGLFVVMLRVFAGATYHGQPFSKLIAFDEAHKYIRDTDLLDGVVEVIRQMRHQATSVLIASQDPPSLPLKVVELSSLVMLHRMDSPGWLKHIQRAITALGDLTAPTLARLRPGEAFLWARSATDPLLVHRAVKIQCRPRATQHGGATKTASQGERGL